MSGAPEAVRARLLALQDEKNAPFMAKLVPTLPPESVLGVRMPDCRSLARELCREPDIGLFLADLPHRYLDENNLHALILNEEKDYAAAVAALDAFLPYVDNWATCDALRPKAFKKHPPDLPDECRRWIKSGETYTVRFGKTFGIGGEYSSRAERLRYLVCRGIRVALTDTVKQKHFNKLISVKGICAEALVFCAHSVSVVAVYIIFFLHLKITVPALSVCIS